MRTIMMAAVLAAIAVGGTEFLAAQGRPVLSPRDSVSLALDTNKISVNYSRPSMRGRVIMGQWFPGMRCGEQEPTRQPI